MVAFRWFESICGIGVVREIGVCWAVEDPSVTPVGNAKKTHHMGKIRNSDERYVSSEDHSQTELGVPTLLSSA